MQVALDEAKLAALENEVPIGACVVFEGRVIARAHNRRESDKSPWAHAEFLAMQQAAEILDRWRLSGCSVYVTLEPCLMCAGLMINSRIDRCVYGSSDPKGGALGTLYNVHADERLNHEFEAVGGVLEDECSQLLKDFFIRRRKEHKQSKEEGTYEKPVHIDIDDLDCLRSQINIIDKQMFSLLQQRLDVAALIARYKESHGMDIFDPQRENDKCLWAQSLADDDEKDLYGRIMSELMEVSREYEKRIKDKQ